jgi:DNA repair photolyase
MNIISASRRTDIPAFHWRWFMNRIDAGYCHWVNPFNAKQVFRVSLRPGDVAGIVFWTRNAAAMLPDIERLNSDGFLFYVQYTINNYPRELEHHSPPAERAVETLRQLSSATSPDRVIWRYDPIILSSHTPPEYHVERFEELAAQLRGWVTSAYFSFCDPYGRTKRHFRAMTRRLGWTFEYGTPEEHDQLAEALAGIASQNGMELYSCAEAALHAQGVKRGSCIDQQLLAKLRPDLRFDLKTAPTREGCGCVQAVDIGAFDTCAFGCEYCYANSSVELPRRRIKECDPEDSILWRPLSLQGVDLESESRSQKGGRISKRENGEQLTIV